MLSHQTGELLGEIHIHRITAGEHSRQLGCRPKYVSATCNGHRRPKGAGQSFQQAFEQLIAQYH